MLGKKSTEQMNAKISSIIGADMVVSGDIHAKEGVRVEGSVTGDVVTDGALIISASGKVKGDVKGSSIFIGGSLEGDLTSGGRTEVVSTGKVIGNIRTKSLVVDENAVFQGQCTMNTEGITPALPDSSSEKKEEQDSQKENNKWNKR
ncbi:MAG: polymer-forming cytoskeletal protein [Lachnospiraceae bacterium]|nr:polymer-forming cytoskeletal protein [Lachnospiraceae bacterium]